MKIDINAHIVPQKYADAFQRRLGHLNILDIHPNVGVDMNVYNPDKRIEIMDKFEGYVQVLTPTGFTLEKHAGPDDATYLAQIHNDAMAELVLKYPDKFVAAVAYLPIDDIDAALKEIDRAINELGLKGIFIHTPINGRPMDMPGLLPIYESMQNYDLPIWIHPTRHYSIPDYAGEGGSKYGVFHAFTWPYETTVAMSRLVGSGIMAKYPDLKFITHHAGAMIPFHASRTGMITSTLELAKVDGELPFEAKPTTEYFRQFYNDTALNGNTPALMCAHAFFGSEHLLFGTDMPYGPGLGEQFMRNGIDAIEGMSIPESDKEKIFEGNAREILHLDI